MHLVGIVMGRQCMINRQVVIVSEVTPIGIVYKHGTGRLSLVMRAVIGPK